MDSANEMQEIIAAFVAESREGLDLTEQSLVVLESGSTDRQILGSIFRAVHTMKGTAGFVGFPQVEAVAHAGENLLSLMRDGRIFPTAEITSTLLALVDELRGSINEIEKTGTEPQRDRGPLIIRLNAHAEAAAPAPTQELSGFLSATLAVPTSSPPIPGFQSPPLASPLTPAYVRPEEPAAPAISVPPKSVEPPVRPSTPAPPPALESPMSVESPTNPTGTKAPDPHKKADSATTRPKGAAGDPPSTVTMMGAANESVRVDVHQLDNLMNLVGELVLARNQLLDESGQRERSFAAASQRLNVVIGELQEGVMKARMQPIGTLLGKLPRVVRDVSLSCGKAVHLETEGEQTELDRTIIEAIRDPLTHIVRNAVDHGIERPEERLRAGKPAEGRITIRAFHEGGQVNIEVSDDGHGIDPERVKRNAVQRGLHTEASVARLTPAEVNALIFMPGLSTAEQVTTVSGRGVGMDVVKTNIERTGGTIDLHSVLGEGLTIKLKIPLTLAIIPALVVTANGERYAIAQASLLELVRLEGEQARKGIERVFGAQVHRLRGMLLPLVHLGHVLSGDEGPIVPGADGAVNIVVVQSDGKPFGLVVDDINDTQEIVVKALGKLVRGTIAFAGATILGDGQVVLIVDVPGIAQLGRLEADGAVANDEELNAKADAGPKETLLLLGTNDGGRMAMRLADVRRLEEFASADLERLGGDPVVQYRGHVMSLVHVSRKLPERRSKSRTEGAAQAQTQAPERLQVVVVGEGDDYTGLVVDEILDIGEETLSLQKSGVRAGVLGTAIIHQRITEVLDIPRLLSRQGME